MESTNRPYVVCHILMALDGKIDGACMSAACAKAYGQLRTTFDCQATIYGTTTMAGTYSDGLAPAVLPAPTRTMRPRPTFTTSLYQWTPRGYWDGMTSMWKSEAVRKPM